MVDVRGKLVSQRRFFGCWKLMIRIILQLLHEDADRQVLKHMK